MQHVEKWISFTTELIPPIRDGSKTLSSRVIVPQPENVAAIGHWQNPDDGTWAWQYQTPTEAGPGLVWNEVRLVGRDGHCPYGKPGTILGVREGYRIISNLSRTRHVAGFYTADKAKFNVELTPSEFAKWERRKFPFGATPGHFMYRSLCRTRLVNREVRVKRVQDITEEGAIAEGIFKHHDHASWTYTWDASIRGQWYGTARWAFKALWNHINATRGFGWDANPWVWRVRFEVRDV